MANLLENLLASGIMDKGKTTGGRLASLLSGLAPLVAEAPARTAVVAAPQLDIDMAALAPRRPRQRASYNPLSGLRAGITPEFLDMLSRKRYMRESVLFPNFSKREGRS